MMTNAHIRVEKSSATGGGNDHNCQAHGQEFQGTQAAGAWFKKSTMEDQSMPVELRLDAQPHPQHSGMFRVRVSGVDGGQKLRAHTNAKTQSLRCR